MKNNEPINARKDEHIRINLDKDVRSGISTGLEKYSFSHCALPEIDLDQIETDCIFLGHKLDFPLILSSMTGGNAQGNKININLAEAAQHAKIAMGVGSQRSMLENPELKNSFNLRKFAPTIPIFGNIGAVQLNFGLTEKDCLRLVEDIQGNGLILHLNPLQEALQPGGDRNFSGLLKKIEKVCRVLNYPVIIKEVGWGISERVAKQLVDAGVSALDVAGAGGTSWSQVERYRMKDERMKRIASHFVTWGLPTVTSLVQIRDCGLKIPIIASGGIKNGVDIAKCMVLGSDLCGMAGRLIPAAADSAELVIDEIEEIKLEMRIVMFATGSSNLKALKKQQLTEKKVYQE